MAEQDNVAIVRGLYEKFGQGDFEGLVSGMTNDITWVIPDIADVSLSGRRQGPESVLEFFRGLADVQDIGEMKIDTIVAQDDVVVVLGSYSRRVKETGSDFSTEFAHAFHLSAGKVKKFQEFLDTAAVAAAHQSRQMWRSV